LAFISPGQAREAARRATVTSRKSVEVLLRESRDTAATSFDIFLSHSVMDREIVLGAKVLIEEKGLTVYIDWIDDPALDRSSISRQSAERIRGRMRQCAQMAYLHTPSSTLSKWCPWELGYFDAYSAPEERVYVIPVLDSDSVYVGQEYLSLYRTIELSELSKRSKVRRSGNASASEDLIRSVAGYRGFPGLRTIL
jgi:hypothetical protein